ncbi:hypothetical protein BKE38_19645 [Pseudoroseomonas deserti]|uniref:Uncharacterized protein n=1 Tax=Teichococcus deserti TaxID=1817963 RepID=A0A1V2GY30_9PROT|nr:hypothetical protein [Pseudoroseomonas deserti]ONG50054.1 hypothetical protein BKE38_19645 [Pseudoroseomonas deserti]
MNRMIRRFCVFLGVGVAIATLASPPARAQENVQRTESYYRNDIYNYGLPRNHHQAPALGLGNIYGLNPCATGVSLGATMPLFGIGGAFSTIDEECQLRNNVALTVSALKDEALAREIMCNVEAFRLAAIRIGRPCIRDGGQPIALTQGVNPETATAAQLMPVPSAGLPPNALPPVPPAQAAPPVNGNPASGNPAAGGFRGAGLAPPRPAFCEMPGLSTASYPECSGAPAEPAAAPPRPAPRPRALPVRAPQAPRPALLPPARVPEASDSPPPAVLGRADGSPAGCESTPAAIRVLFAECVAAERQSAMAAVRRAHPAPEIAPSSLAAR